MPADDTGARNYGLRFVIYDRNSLFVCSSQVACIISNAKKSRYGRRILITSCAQYSALCRSARVSAVRIIPTHVRLPSVFITRLKEPKVAMERKVLT